MATWLRAFGASLRQDIGFRLKDDPDRPRDVVPGETNLSFPPRVRLNLPIMRRINLFWMAVVVVVLVAGAVSAVHDQPRLWQSWRGPSLIALPLCTLLWYMMLPYLRQRLGFPLPGRLAYSYLAIGFILSALLLDVSTDFVGVVYMLIGMTTAVLPIKKTVVPIGLAVVMYLWSIGVLQHLSASPDVFWQLFSIAMSIGITFTLAALIRQRYELEYAVRDLREAQRRLRIAAARDADLAALRERNRLAREMHDSLGHALVSIAIKLEAVQRLYAVDVERATAEMEETKALVRSTMADLRQSLAGLRPAALEEQPLTSALRELGCELGRTRGITVSVDVPDEADALDRPVQETLYRVVQEGLANIAKHARADHAWVSLTIPDGSLTLEVADDGVGLGATPRSPNGHYGILGMRERVEALDGTLTIGPRPGGGTLLRVRLPREVGAPRV